ncbi:MAG: hypothetical protein RIT81_47435 [Deltaproteobacteria bacterium]
MTTSSNTKKQLLTRYGEATRGERFDLFQTHARLREAFLGIEAENIAKAMRAARLRRLASTEG